MKLNISRRRPQPYFGVALLSLGLLLSSAAASAQPAAEAAEVTLPAQAIWPDASVAFWIDVSAVSPDSVESAMQAVADATPEARQEAVQAWVRDSRQQLKLWSDSYDTLTRHGVEAICLVSSAGLNGEADAAPSEQVLVKAEAGADLTAAYAEVHGQLQQLQDGQADELPAPAEVEFEPLDDGWHLATHKELRGRPDEPADAGRLEAALQWEAGAAVRMAWVINDEARQSIREMAVSPEAVMFSGLIQPMTKLDDATGGLRLGNQPEARLAIQFEDAQTAAEFNVTLQGMIRMFGGLMLLGGQPEDPASQEKLNVVLSMLLLDQDDARLSKTFDVAVVSRMAEVGLIFAEEQPIDSGEE